MPRLGVIFLAWVRGRRNLSQSHSATEAAGICFHAIPLPPSPHLVHRPSPHLASCITALYTTLGGEQITLMVCRQRTRSQTCDQTPHRSHRLSKDHTRAIPESGTKKKTTSFTPHGTMGAWGTQVVGRINTRAAPESE